MATGRSVAKCDTPHYLAGMTDLTPLFKEGDHLICTSIAPGLRLGGRYRVIEVEKDVPLYFGRCVVVYDTEEKRWPSPVGYFPWRFERVFPS